MKPRKVMNNVSCRHDMTEILLRFEPTTPRLTVLSSTTVLLVTINIYGTCNIYEVLKMSLKVCKMPTCLKTMKKCYISIFMHDQASFIIVCVII